MKEFVISFHLFHSRETDFSPNSADGKKQILNIYHFGVMPPGCGCPYPTFRSLLKTKKASSFGLEAPINKINYTLRTAFPSIYYFVLSLGGFCCLWSTISLFPIKHATTNYRIRSIPFDGKFVYETIAMTPIFASNRQHIHDTYAHIYTHTHAQLAINKTWKLSHNSIFHLIVFPSTGLWSAINFFLWCRLCPL